MTISEFTQKFGYTPDAETVVRERELVANQLVKERDELYHFLRAAKEILYSSIKKQNVQKVVSFSELGPFLQTALEALVHDTKYNGVRVVSTVPYPGEFSPTTFPYAVRTKPVTLNLVDADNRLIEVDIWGYICRTPIEEGSVVFQYYMKHAAI